MRFLQDSVRLFLALWLATAPVYAGSMTLLGAGKPAGGAAFSLIKSDSIANATNTTTINYGTLSYSSTATRVLVAVGYSTSVAAQTISTLTVGGLTAVSQIAGCYVQQGASFGTAVDLYIGTPTGSSSGAVSVTYSAATTQGSSVALYNLTTTSPAVAGQTNASAGFAGSLANTLNIPAGGGAIIIVETQNNAVSTITNGAIDVAPTARETFGHSTVTGAGSVLTANLSGSDVVAMCSASWGP